MLQAPVQCRKNYALNTFLIRGKRSLVRNEKWKQILLIKKREQQYRDT